MKKSLPLAEMTVAEKLQAMEELWADLQRTPEAVPSPDWHGQVLHERAHRVANGTEPVLDWAVVRQQLLDRQR